MPPCVNHRQAELIRARQHANERRALADAAHGYCEVTDGPGNCTKDAKGSWMLLEEEAMNKTAAALACRRRCSACGRCRFFSFSAHFRDCSWFWRCSLGKLGAQVGGFRTFELARSGSLSSAAGTSRAISLAV